MEPRGYKRGATAKRTLAAAPVNGSVGERTYSATSAGTVPASNS